MLGMFNNKQKYTILSKTGYTGSDQEDEMEAFMQSKPEARSLVLRLERKAKDMQGVPTTPPESKVTGMKAGGMTEAGSVSKPEVSYIKPNNSQLIKPLKNAKATTAGVSTVSRTDTVKAPAAIATTTYSSDSVAGDVKKETENLEPVKGEVSDESLVDAAQQNESSVSGLKAAQGTAIMMENPVQREIQDGELISGAADAAKASEFTEQIQAATATPSDKATVQGQLDNLMQDFEGGETPAWAAGALRNATSAMAARGLGASSLAGQALVQAAMESALPIAQADASVTAQFESQNLSNRQQRAMLAAQQRAEFIGQEFNQEFQARVANSARIGDIANMNFTAEQQVALENSRAANTMALNNLSNDQAMVMAEASALANLDMANLSNRQQAAVQNAQAFLQMDMININNEQQTSLFKAQQNIQALFTDQAAENAALQFNAASENQTKQFFADLQLNASKFNADQKNSMKQFNVNSVNATRQFNVAQNNQFRQFMTSSNLVVSQANAKWRQTAAIANQEASNERNMYVAKEQNALSNAELDEIWQRERDEMDYVFNAYQNDVDRSNAIILQKLVVDGELDAAELQAKIGANKQIGQAFLNWLF